MLKILRKKGVAKKILWVIAIVIIISFGFFGTAYLLTGSPTNTYAGKLFGKAVSIDQFNQNLKFMHVQALITYGDNYARLKPFLNLEAETWDRLILLAEARKRKIQIPDKEIVETIEKKYVFFHRDGQFDSLLYEDILRLVLRITAREFEEGVRESLKIAKLYEQVTFPVMISEEEVSEKYKKQNEKTKIDFVLIPYEDFKNQVSLEENQIEQYYKDHQNEFFLPPAINIEYLAFELPFEPNEANSETNTEEKINLAQKAQEVYQELLTNPDLNKIAQKHSMNVGTTGFFSQEQPNLQIGWSYELLHQAFQLKEEGISRPIETAKGWYILKLKKKRDAYIPEYTEAKDKAKDALLLQEAKKLAKTQAERYLSDIKGEFNAADDNFIELTKSLGLKAEQTPEFIRGQYLPTVGISQDFEATAFSLNQDNKMSDVVVESLKGYCLLHLASYIPPNGEQFEKEKTALTEAGLTEKKTKAFNDFLSQLRLRANLKDFTKELKSQGPL